MTLIARLTLLISLLLAQPAQAYFQSRDQNTNNITPITAGVVLDARAFAGGTHAGTIADPWPCSAIVAALNALPQPAGGTVFLVDGIWSCTSENKLNVNNYILTGTSLNAIIRFTSPGGTTISSLWFQTGGNQNSSITGLTIDGNNIAANNTSPIRISNPRNFSLSNNNFLGTPNGAIPVFFIEGGNDVLVDNNVVTAAPGHGGDMFQLQPLGGTQNARFTVTNNQLFDSALVIIGLDETVVRNNTLLNPSGGFIHLVVCGLTGSPAHNDIIDGNTVDATFGGLNGAYLGGIPNDPGLGSEVTGFQITNNIVKGSEAYIGAQSESNINYTDNTLVDNIKINVTITGNTIISHFATAQARIDIRGGTGSLDNSKVDTVTISGNTLTPGAGGTKIILGDANTFNVTVNQPGVTIVGFTPLP